MRPVDAARLGWKLARGGVSAAAGRRTRGPRRPGWSFRFEAVMCAFQAERAAVEGAPVDWPRYRRELEAVVPPSPVLRGVSVAAARLGRVPGEWVAPGGLGSEAPVILWLHGGGYTSGSAASHRELVARIALSAGARVAVPEYRLAPEAPFPAAVDDAVDAWRALIADNPPDRIVIGGDSAGGGLALALLLRARDEGLPLPAAAVLVSPWVDLTATAASIDAHRDLDWCSRRSMILQRDAYLQGRDPREPLASPLFAQLHGLPPLLVQVGTAEMLLDDAIGLARRAQEAGVEVELQRYDDMPHVWHVLAAIEPAAQRAIDAIGSYVRGRSGKTAR